MFCMSKPLKMELPLWDLGSPKHQLLEKCEHISYWDRAGGGEREHEVGLPEWGCLFSLTVSS